MSPLQSKLYLAREFGRAEARAGTRVQDSEAVRLMWAALQKLDSRWERELRFSPLRLWRFDFALKADRLAVEIEGGLHNQGRHVRAAGYADDCAKYNAAQLHQWRVLRYSREQIESGEAIAQVEEAMRQSDLARRLFHDSTGT